MFADSRKMSAPREIAKHLAKLKLREKEGIENLHPELQIRAVAFLNKCSAAHYPVAITDTLRSVARQQSYYEQGRSEPGPIVTNAEAYESYHNYGLAFDFKFLTPNAPFITDKSVLKFIGELGVSCGLVWGGDFGDFQHFEYHPNFTWENLKPYFNEK